MWKLEVRYKKQYADCCARHSSFLYFGAKGDLLHFEKYLCKLFRNITLTFNMLYLLIFNVFTAVQTPIIQRIFCDIIAHCVAKSLPSSLVYSSPRQLVKQSVSFCCTHHHQQSRFTYVVFPPSYSFNKP